MYKYIENVRKDLLNVFFLVSKNRNVRSACFTNSSLILFSHWFFFNRWRCQWSKLWQSCLSPSFWWRRVAATPRDCSVEAQNVQALHLTLSRLLSAPWMTQSTRFVTSVEGLTIAWKSIVNVVLEMMLTSWLFAKECLTRDSRYQVYSSTWRHIS